MSRIVQLIDDIEDFFEQCNNMPFTNKVVVDKDDIYELMTELRLKVPDEIKKSNRIVEERDKIVGDAKKLAQEITKEAESKITELVNDHEIMEKANKEGQHILEMAKKEGEDILNKANEQANNMVDQAKKDAKDMRVSALAYVDDHLEQLEKITATALNEAKADYNKLINDLSKNLEVIKVNRAELNGSKKEK
ncbi:hypothetical protein EDC19_0741 [Natranaerovirga hydrolytica]|uniref:ATPase n=1 Tax=Natranaerovirga hydrolytica TaxID=680378 RepID=A0A4V2Q1N6_9FIRM|nr:ATPase [Natranaerovirga hydrolytica]TCK98321.1 hypothetical protein EDC19_0741 [Natranaerovirga hydrolytica]